MHSSFRLAFTLLVGLVMCLGCSGESDEGSGVATTATNSTTSDVERLQGKWAAVSSFSDGVEFDPTIISQLTMTITDDVMVSAFPDGTGSQAMFTVDETQSPKAIDLTAGQSDRSMGIYRLDGDQLTICIRSDGVRPMEFTSEGEGSPTLSVFQRSPE